MTLIAQLSRIPWRAAAAAFVWAGVIFVCDLYTFGVADDFHVLIIRNPDGALFYAVLAAAMYACLGVLLTASVLRPLFLILIYLSHAIVLGFHSVSYSSFTVNDLELVLYSADNWRQAIDFYGRTFVPWIVIAAGVYFAAFSQIRKLYPGSRQGGFATAAVLCVTAWGVVQLARLQDSETKVLPGPLQPYVAAAEYALAPRYVGPRGAPPVAPSRPRAATHIIFIVDESVRGDLMQLNGHPLVNTPFMASPESGIFNYGVASSITNLTQSSNYSLMTGLRSDQLPDYPQNSRHAASIFHYAAAAGMKLNVFYSDMHRTVINAWTGVWDGLEIDVRHIAKARYYLSDRDAIEHLARLTADNTPSFTWLLKWGCHFPYAGNFPPDEVFLGSKDAEVRARYSQNEIDYHNCMSWNVDRFARKLSEKLRGRDVVVIYTSDHGQSLNRAPGITTHGQFYRPHPEQARVPLLFMGFNEPTRAALAQVYRAENVNRVSATQLFSTALYLMGYGLEDLKQYDPPVFAAQAPARRLFLSGNLWGLGPVYMNDFEPGIYSAVRP